MSALSLSYALLLWLSVPKAKKPRGAEVSAAEGATAVVVVGRGHDFSNQMSTHA